MSWKVSEITKKVTITNPDSAESAELVLCRLSEGDKVAAATVATNAEGTLAEGVFEIWREYVNRSVVSGLPFELEELGEVDPRVLEQLIIEIKLFNPGIWPTAMSQAEKLERAEALAEGVAMYLDPDLLEEGSDLLTLADLAILLADYTGEAIERPTETPSEGK